MQLTHAQHLRCALTDGSMATAKMQVAVCKYLQHAAPDANRYTCTIQPTARTTELYVRRCARPKRAYPWLCVKRTLVTGVKPRALRLNTGNDMRCVASGIEHTKLSLTI